MSSDLPKMFGDKVTDINVAAQYPVGTRRFEGGNEYVYMQADDAFTAGQAAKIDSATGVKCTPTAAATDGCIGVAEIAVTDEYFFWLTVRGPASALIADSTSAGEILAPSATAGVLAVAPTSTARRKVIGEAAEANSTGAAAAKVVYLYG